MNTISCKGLTHHIGCECHESRRNMEILNLKKENKRIRNALIYLINVMVEDHSSKMDRSDGNAFRNFWNDAMKLGNSTVQNMINVDKKTAWECTNCGYINSVKNGPCFGCKLSSPPRKEINE